MDIAAYTSFKRQIIMKLYFILIYESAVLYAPSQSTTNLRHSYSMLQYGHKLDRRMITSYDGYSILDCVEDCLRTTRCRSVNYHQGAHFCQTNFETNVSSPDLYLEKPGWIYSARSDWDKEIAGRCSLSNCSINEKCIPKPFGEFSCILSDCGVPSDDGFSLKKVNEWDAIGITRGIHVTCMEEFEQRGSELFICRSDGSWKTDLNCTFKAGCYKDIPDRVLGNGPIYPTMNGKMYCKRVCQRLGEFKYFGLQNGNECFCGTKIRFSPERLHNSECNLRCKGNDDETCGQSWKMEIYLI